jgi:hypothetical protein
MTTADAICDRDQAHPRIDEESQAHVFEANRLARGLWLLLNSKDTDFDDERDIEAMRGIAAKIMDELVPVVGALTVPPSA